MTPIARSLTDRIPAAAAVGLAAVGSAPIALLLARTTGTPTFPDQPFLDAGAFPLLGKTILIAAGAATLATLLGSVLGVTLARAGIPGRRIAVAVLFGAFCVSPYVLGLGWLGVDRTAPWAAQIIASPIALAGVLGLGYAPLAALLILAGVVLRPGSQEDAGLLAGGPAKMVRYILFPSIRGLAALAWLAVAVLGISDYAVASLLQVPTYPIEIFLYYSGVFDRVAAARACVPLLVLGTALAVGLAALLPRAFPLIAGSSPAGTWSLSRRTRAACTVAVLVALAVSPGIPLAFVGSRLPSAADASVAILAGAPAVGNTLLLAAGAALLSIALAWPASAWLANLGRGSLVAFAAVLAFPICVPASAYGIAWVELVSLVDPGVAGEGALRPVVCLAFRYGGIATLFLAAARQTLAGRGLDAARLHEGAALVREIRIVLPALLPSLLAVTGLLFARQLNATGILVLTAPPGFEVLALRADNLLHYGRPEEAGLLALLTAAVAVVPTLLLLALGRRMAHAQR